MAQLADRGDGAMRSGDIVRAHHWTFSPPRPTEIYWSICNLGIGAGQKILGVDVGIDFVLGNEGVQFPAVEIYIKDTASVQECSKRILVRHMWNLHSPPNCVFRGM